MNSCVSLECFEQIEKSLRKTDNLLKIFMNGEWRYICSNNFGQLEADLAYKKLKGNSATVISYTNTSCKEDIGFWISNVKC